MKLKKYSHLFLLICLGIMSILKAKAQTDTTQLYNEKLTTLLVKWINENQIDSIYSYFDSTMKKGLSKDVFTQSMNKEIHSFLPIENYRLVKYEAPVSYYRMKIKNDSLHFQVATNTLGQISGIYLKPLNIQQKILPTTSVAKTLDSVAQLAYQYLNEKNAPAIYGLQGTDFQKAISAEKFNQMMTAQIFPLLPIQQFDYIKTKDSVSKYRAELAAGLTLQIIFKLDNNRKLSGFMLQPYQEEQDQQAIEWHDNALITPLDSLVHKAVIEKINKTTTHALSLAVLQDLKVYYYNYGIAKPATNQHPINTMLYEIGSITKTFTGYILADAVIKKKVKLSDPITKYLPEKIAKNKFLQAITLQHLANHTSGLPRLPDNMAAMLNSLDPYAQYDREMLYEYLEKYTTNNTPGKTYAYSNLGFGLLGTILENVYQKSYEELCSQLIFRPFKMKNTYAHNITDSTMVATGFNEKGQQTPYWNFQSMQAAGSVKSNTEDLVKYALQFTQKQTKTGKFTPTIELLMQPTYNNGSTSISLGWHFGELSPSIKFMEHSGGTYGFRSNIMIVPDKNLAIIALINGASEGLVEQINREVLSEISKQ